MSIWAKSHLLKSGNQWRSKQNQWRSKQVQGTFGRTPSRTKMVAKVWLTYQTDTVQVTTKLGKKHVMISFRLRKLEDSRYKVATQYKSARNLPTSIMEHTKNPWLCISHPAPAAWAFSSAYQGVARRKTNELIPEWCQQIQSDSIAVTFKPIHGINLEKIGHTKISRHNKSG